VIDLQWPKGSQPLDPNEWDFRGLMPDEFDAAFTYEIAREDPKLDDALSLLAHAGRHELQRISKEDWNNENHKWLSGESTSRQFNEYWDIFNACWCCGDFPLPWMGLEPTKRRLAVERFGKRAPARLVTREEFLRSEEIRKLHEQVLKDLGYPVSGDSAEDPMVSTRQYIIDVDWSTDDTILGPALLKTVLALRPKGTRPAKLHRGQRARPAAFRFRQIAAYRLGVKGRLRYKDTWELIRQRKKTVPRPDKFKVLPNYDSHGAWNGAVKAGRLLITRGLL